MVMKSMTGGCASTDARRPLTRMAMEKDNADTDDDNDGLSDRMNLQRDRPFDPIPMMTASSTVQMPSTDATESVDSDQDGAGDNAYAFPNDEVKP